MTSVLHVITRLNVGGPARHVLSLVAGLRERGFDARLVWGAEGPEEGRLEPPSDLPQVHVPSLRRPLRPWRDAAAYLALRREIRGWRPQIVHTHTAKAGALGRVAARRAGVPRLVHTFHGHVLSGYFSRGATASFRRIERALGPRTDAFVAVSPQVAAEVVDLGVADASRVHVVPLSLDLAPFLGSTLEAGEARRRLGLSPEAPVMLTAGRLVAVKDIATFLEAAAIVAGGVEDLVVLVAGDGELRDELEGIGRRLLGDRVRFCGWVEDLEPLYAAADVVVLTSRNEGTPVALIEAAAMGRAVVATDVGGVPDVVLHGRTGVLAGAGDADAIARAVVALLTDPERARRLGEAGRELVLERWAADRTLDAMADLYRTLLEH